MTAGFLARGCPLADPAAMRRLGPRARALAMLGLLASCSEAPPPRQPAQVRPADKAALYGDAALLPTRAGEHARAEVALAEEIRVALETLRAVEKARVTVRARGDGTPSSAALVIRTREREGLEALEATARRIAKAALGRDDVELAVELSPPDSDLTAEDTPRPVSLVVLFAVLGLGISLGLTFDRTRRLLQRRR